VSGGLPGIEAMGEILRVSGRVTADQAGAMLTAGMDLLQGISVIDLVGITDQIDSYMHDRSLQIDPRTKCR